MMKKISFAGSWTIRFFAVSDRNFGIGPNDQICIDESIKCFSKIVLFFRVTSIGSCIGDMRSFMMSSAGRAMEISRNLPI